MRCSGCLGIERSCGYQGCHRVDDVYLSACISHSITLRGYSSIISLVQRRAPDQGNSSMFAVDGAVCLKHCNCRRQRPCKIHVTMIIQFPQLTTVPDGIRLRVYRLRHELRIEPISKVMMFPHRMRVRLQLRYSVRCHQVWLAVLTMLALEFPPQPSNSNSNIDSIAESTCISGLTLVKRPETSQSKLRCRIVKRVKKWH